MVDRKDDLHNLIERASKMRDDIFHPPIPIH